MFSTILQATIFKFTINEVLSESIHKINTHRYYTMNKIISNLFHKFKHVGINKSLTNRVCIENVIFKHRHK